MANWIIPCNPKLYDVFAAFRELETIDWRQTAKNIEVGDTVYVYIGRPIQSITHKCIVIDVNISYADSDDSDDRFNLPEGFVSLQPYERYMRLHLVKEYPPHALDYSLLVENGLVGSIQGQRHTGSIIQSVIDSIDN